jgi:predicted HTH transcriptional regulator
MKETELLQILVRGENSRHKFERNETNVDSISAELVTFANSGGGILFVGVTDSGQVTGLDAAGVRRFNQLISNITSQNVQSPVHLTTKNIQTAQGIVIVVTVANGLNKPYRDNLGRIWVKDGADKRQVTAPEEIQRMFPRPGLIHTDVIPVENTSIADLDEKAFNDYFARRYGQSPEASGQTLSQVLQSIGLGDGQKLNLASLLLFGKSPQRYRPVSTIKAVAFPGTVRYDIHYLDSEDIDGTLSEQYRRSLAFVKRNLHHIQGNQNFNSLGILEIPEQVIVELLVNALVHRDYFASASILLLIFADRIEIISPGHLPDGLSMEQVLAGKSIRRNFTLADHATKILPYRGTGTGIARVLKDWPETRLIDDVAGNEFKAVIARPVIKQITSKVTQKVTSKTNSKIVRLLGALQGEMSAEQIMAKLGLKDKQYFRVQFQQVAIANGLIEEITLPDEQHSGSQHYRPTAMGLRYLAIHSNSGSTEIETKDTLIKLGVQLKQERVPIKRKHLSAKN